MEKRSNKFLLVTAVCFCLLALVGAIGFFLFEKNEINQNADKFKEIAGVEEVSRPDEGSSFEDGGEGQAITEKRVDFAALKAVNPDIYAWISIEGTNIEYPLLRSETEDFYLDHNAEKKKSAYGALYTQKVNSDTFEDFNTVIYGHNMRNGSMFGSLKKYRNRNWFDSHREVVIYTPEKVLKYKVFAAYVYDDRHILYSYDFSDAEGRAAYLKEILSGQYGGNLAGDIKVGTDDRIITLSTCYAEDDERYLVQAVLTESVTLG